MSQMYGYKCSRCGLVSSVEQASNRIICRRCQILSFVFLNQSNNRLIPHAILSTGDVPGLYDIVRLVYAFGNSAEGLFAGANPVQAYELVSGMLEARALELGANAVIHIRFDHRLAISTVPVVNIHGQVFEIYGYGTAVRIRPD